MVAHNASWARLSKSDAIGVRDTTEIALRASPRINYFSLDTDLRSGASAHDVHSLPIEHIPRAK